MPRTMKKTLAIIIIVLSANISAEERKWMTIEELPNSDSLKLYWVGVFEGFDSIYKIEVVKKNTLISTFEILGQPLFSKNKSYLAVKNCWHGGCNLDIRLLDLVNYRELMPIKTKNESFLDLVWDGPVLSIEMGAMSSEGKTERMSVLVKDRKASNKSPNSDAQ